MDQGVAAVWAGLAGLAGAGIGGAAAAWGAWISGRKTVEAAERQAQRAAAAEHQQWQRQARYEAYRELLSIAEEMTRWTRVVTIEATMETANRLREAMSKVYVVGPAEASRAAGRLLGPVLDALFVHVAATTEGVSVPNDTPIAWDADRSNELMVAHAEFREVVRAILDRPPT
jgi:hypothetical protein